MKYRPEIDGLRAFAVFPVILFHAGFSTFSGGFVGVDVFFVISGYLITTIILSEMEQGTFSIANFYERRARRILPALFLVILVSLPCAWFWLLPSDMKDFSKSLVAVSFFSSNILFSSESGYWDVASELKPLLHTWSLAVEEQYYLLFPLFMMAMWRFRKRWFFCSLIIIAAVSLAAAQWGAHHKPSAAFYLLPTRGWELAIGASIAFYFIYRKPLIRKLLFHKTLDELFGLLGLAMIGYSIFIFDEQTPFPSLYSLVPTVGAGLIILFSSPQTVAGRLLSTKLFVGIGLISYSAYLWHQPLLVFARHRALEEPNDIVYAALALFSMVIAYVSWRFVEKPFRDRKKFNRKTIFVFSVSGSMFFIIIGACGYIAEGFDNRSSIPSTVERSVRSNAAQCFDRDYSHWNDYWLCRIDSDNIFRDKGTPPDFLAIGDSHLYSFIPALQLIAENENLSGAYVGYSGCPPLLNVYSLRNDQDKKNCHELNNRIFEYTKKNKIKDIVLIARWTYYTDGNYSGSDQNFLGWTPTDIKTKEHSRQVFAKSFYETIRAYGEAGVNVHVLSQVPMQKNYPLKVYYKSYMDGEFDKQLFSNIVIDVAEHKQLNEFVESIFRKGQRYFPEYDIHLYDLSKPLCNTSKCMIGTHAISYYYDDDHLSVEGAKFVGASLRLNLGDRVSKNNFK